VTENAVTESASEPEAAAPEAAPSAPVRRRSLKRATKIRLLVIGVLAVLAAAAFVIYYIFNTSNYVTTDNAQIDGNQISINAPATGTLIDWRGQQGTQLHKNASVGRIQIQGGYVQPQMVIRSPADGTVAVDNGVFVTARVKETDIDKVQVGRAVNISVDAFPGEQLTGRVAEVKAGAAGVFSLFPQSNTSGNFQKVTQVIPVKITIDDLKNLPLVPGMNVTVKIHRN